MKFKFLFFLLALACVMTSQAQIKKGSLLLGGSIGYNQDKSDVLQTAVTAKNNTFTFSLPVGVAIKENLVAGVRFDYLKVTQKSKYDANNYNNLEIDNKNYGGGLFIRRYVPVINRLYVFGEGTASYKVIRETATQTYNSSKLERKSKGWSTGLSFTPGVSYGVSKKFQIEGGFNSLFNASYAKSKTTYNNNTQSEKQESFSGGISHDDESMFYVGFRFIL